MDDRILIFVLAGVLNGLVTGTTGANGMVLILSILMMAGVGIHETIGTCLAVQVFTMTTALITRATRSELSGRLVLVLCVPAISASFAGAKLALRVPGALLEGLVMGLLLVVGLLLLRPRSTMTTRIAEDRGHDVRPGALARMGLVGTVSGGLAGLVGGGGNIVVANAVHKLLGLPFRSAVALSLCLGITAATLGVVPYLLDDRLDASIVPWVLAPALVAAWMSSRWSHRVSVPTIRRIQGAYLMIVATALAARACSGGG